MAHDFNNLLTIFHGYTELLQMSIASDDPRQEYLAEMERAVERARGLTIALLDFNREKNEKPAPIAVGSVLLGFRRMLRRVAREDLEFAIHAEDGRGWALATRGALDSILLNLALNACEAMPRGGRLTIELDEITLSATDRRVRAGWKPGPYVRISVRDTGTGIPKGDRKRIFEPGFTTHPERKAPGLGLPISAMTARELGGQLTIESSPGKGSVARLFLPRGAAPPRQEPRPTARKTPAAFGKGRTALVVDDDEAACKAIAAMLRRLGFQPRCAANGEEALRMLERDPGVHLLVADLMMPLMGGAALAETVGKRWPGIAIVLVSGYGTEPPEATGSQGNSCLFLPKPLAFSALASKLRRLLNV